ncbi:MAG: ABC transporter permease, partial [Chloroflexi bacterium]
MRRKLTSGIGLGLLSLGIFLILWQGVVRLGGYPAFILPPPRLVVARLGKLLTSGTLWLHTSVTLREILAGLGLGALMATLLGYGLAHFPAAEQLLVPFIVASQSVPTVAIAPLLVIWFGTGILSKVLVCALIVFFPILVNTVVGVRSVKQNLRD